ncbi:DUF397 domain-containing protein [Streptomyces sp. NBC_00859]|uniref:DUF397 domain-containing protein n=1 Tax=Streptomyces sp. NBC_00859 TaxID=2903682 RepID=UPI00386D0606
MRGTGPGATPQRSAGACTITRTPGGSDCVEAASAPGAVHVRDSRNVQGPDLGFTPDLWADLVAYACAS